jgi:hypothetical protein
MLFHENQCHQCYCFVCDTPVDQFGMWEKNHCHATDQGKWSQIWHERRELQLDTSQQRKRKSTTTTNETSKKRSFSASSNSKQQEETESAAVARRRTKYSCRAQEKEPAPKEEEVKVDTIHYRMHCRVHEFNSSTVVSNQNFCHECYCLVCDEPAAQCYAWNNSHCHATESGEWRQLWHQRRALHRQEKLEQEQKAARK